MEYSNIYEKAENREEALRYCAGDSIAGLITLWRILNAPVPTYQN